ncbi:MAG: aspartate carbamoyltransferase [Candidatus Lindowbacteria bacterium RIFCSPLOWO2_12_FULL_62_27]|nr:MAG: aspartate carbamoyltransferase [Candidatus Lindowbacteria bacterium RIFCSPLOWO2_12_FULL_62_27]OGH62203.1 MAG: aspartate carbamoyltransferase [Candidatus Lindowbacteria bacterium RIFCSPLOWO2_02_FULL_62_12]
MTRKDLLDIETLSLDEIHLILETAKPFKELFTRSVKKVPPLKGKTVLQLFYEPSTRTRTSFEIAAKRLSADVANFAVAQSSVVKGESILDTVATLQSMKSDFIVIRHSVAGVPELIARNTTASVINAGDGFHAHPTQALLDAYTLREIFPDLAGKKVLIVGDILHSRVARSTSRCLHRLGMNVAVFGAGTLIPSTLPPHLSVFSCFEEALRWEPDVVYLLRLQLERQKANFFPSMREYHHSFGVTRERYRDIVSRGIYVMHPGPVNRGVELIDEVMDYERCLINQQVENGIAVRMAVLYLLNLSVQEKAPDLAPALV